MTDGTGATSYGYDALDRVITTTTGAGRSVGYGYDAVGNTVAITYPDGSQVTRAYDTLDRLSSVRDWLSHTARFGYNAADNLITQTLPTSTTTSIGMGYDAAERLTGITDTTPLTSWAYAYSRDKAGEIVGAVDPLDGKAHTYSYDKLAGLIGDSQGSSGVTSTVGWTNDAAREVTRRLDPSGPYTSTLTYDNAHELTGTLTLSGTTTTHNLSFLYNKNGDRTSQTDSVGSAARSYGYDQADRLITATTGITSTTYAYDGDGLRQSKAVSGTTTAETWDTAAGLPTLLQDGATRYIAGPDGLPIEQIDGNGSVQYYLRDQLGSTRALLDGAGHTLATYSYDAYGNPTGRTGNATTPFGHAGAYTDAETGLQYLQARYYDPATQQFMSVDPLVDQTGQPYVYTYADPLNMADPTGLDSGCNGASGQGLGRAFSAFGDLGCNIGEAKDTALGTAGALAAPPCDVLHGGCRLPTGQEAANQAGQWKDATGTAIATTASDVGAALRPGCVPGLQACRWDTPQEELRTDYSIFAGLYGGVNALTFGGEANLGAYAGLDNNALQCTPEYGQGSRLAIAGSVALGGYGAARGALGLAGGLRGAAELPSVARYGDMSGRLDPGVQANHLNQDAAFSHGDPSYAGPVIPSADGTAVGIRGNAFTEPGTPHYEFHASLERFWSQFRRGGARFGDRPTNAEYSQGLYNALRAAGYSSREASFLQAQAQANRLAYGLADTDRVPRIPGRLPQR